ncbi:MAG: L,D-transpeptidase family protein [Desulfocapsaceae bacterium]
MRKMSSTRICIILLTTLFLCFDNVSSGASGLKGTVIQYLELGPAKHLKVNAHGMTAAEIDERIIRIYREHDFQPFWIQNGKPSHRAIVVRSVLENANLHGLNPASYLVGNIQQFWSNTDAPGLVQLDILITLGMMLYVADQREGRIAPFLANPELFATARDVKVDWNAVREQALNAPDMQVFLEQQAPPYFQYRQLLNKLAEYRQIAANGGWPSIPSGATLKPGMQDPRVPVIRQRLSVTGELGSGELISPTFDAELAVAVKQFQKRHNLAQDGIIGHQTLKVLNVPVSTRIVQIVINMERYRWMNRVLDERGVFVNIAGFEAFGGEPGNMEIEMPVIVGKTYHETPVFSDTIKYIVINPYWNLTPSIAYHETLPKLKADPHYLEKHNMRIFEGWGENAPELDATAIDWSNVTRQQMNRYRVRQEPGPENALGTLKLVFPNKFNVYLHDTPAHDLFKRDRRAFSHGCIRMGRPAEMAAFVLGGQEKGWSVERIKEMVKSQKRQVVKLEKPMPVHILYRTAYINPADESIYFFEDLYGRDKILASALFNKTKR